MTDRRGIWIFLAITFALTYAIEGALIASGFRISDLLPAYGQFIIAGVMWVPALATVLTVYLICEGFASLNLRFGPWRPYVKTALVIPATFALIYALTWLFGLGRPDWGLTQFREMMTMAGADLSSMPEASTMLPALLLSTVFLTPFINAIFAFGEELGWRGYLLPKLMPLGKPKAYALMGLIWGLWHAPLVWIGFNYPGYPLAGIFWMTALVTGLGIYINELSLRHRSVFLAAWMHGAFNSQGYGIWRLLFPSVNPLWGGMTGVVAIALWLALGIWEARQS